MPLLKVVKSVPVWALQFSLVGFYWVIYTIISLMPLYLDMVYDMPVDLVRESPPCIFIIFESFDIFCS